MSQTTLANALTSILKGPNGDANPGLCLLDYSNGTTFENHWRNALGTPQPTINGQSWDCNKPGQQFLLIGNEPPDAVFQNLPESLRGINFRGHFTATSWLAAWKVKFTPAEEEWKAEKKEAPARMAVIDPRESGLASGAARALQTILGAQDASHQTLIPRVTVLNAPSLTSICQWLAASQADQRPTPDHLRDLLKSTIWNGLTSRSEQHHALSNVLGPIILSGSKMDEKCWAAEPANQQAPTNANEEEERISAARKAANRAKDLLRRLLQACDLVSWKDTPDPPSPAVNGNEEQAQNRGSKVQPQEPSLPEPLEEGAELSILLLDDQEAQGWADWVQECLPRATHQSVDDPTSLAEIISQALKLNNTGGAQQKDARFGLCLPKLDGAKNPVLLLDLRLFAGKPEAERKFYKDNLLPLVKHFTDKPDLAWLGFSSSDEAFNRARQAVESGKLEVDSAEHHEVLTWLPRVVALADMSLPIVLFSSTGRRDLVEPFKPYGNIITGFEKPRLTDLASSRGTAFSAREATIGALRVAVTLAHRWLRCRTTAQRILTTSIAPLEAARQRFAGKNYFELYHDETGAVENPNFSVVSLLSGFENSATADAYDGAFPVKFYGANPEPKRANRGEPHRWQTKIWPAVKDNCPPLLLSIAARDPHTVCHGDADSIFAPGGLDNINWDLLALSWESLLMDVLPSLLKGRGSDAAIEVAVYGATRYRLVKLNARTAEAAVAEANQLLSAMWEQWRMNVAQYFRDCYVADNQGKYVSEFDKSDCRLYLSNAYAFSGTVFTLYWRSLKQDAFWKLVTDVLFGRQDSNYFGQVSRAIKRAFGITLLYDKSSGMDEGCRHLHYLADLAGGLVEVDFLKQRVTTGIPPFDQPESRGVAGIRGRILVILNANRLLDAGGCACEALAAFEQLNHEHPGDIAYLSLAERLEESLPTLRGEEVKRLESLLENPPQWVTTNRVETPERIGAPPTSTAENTRQPEPDKNRHARQAASTTMAERRQLPLCYTERWRVLRFRNAADYYEFGTNWHLLNGYQVRQASNGRITVFADITLVKQDELPTGFTEPVTSSFKDDGTLLGVPWRALE